MVRARARVDLVDSSIAFRSMRHWCALGHLKGAMARATARGRGRAGTSARAIGLYVYGYRAIGLYGYAATRLYGYRAIGL